MIAQRWHIAVLLVLLACRLMVRAQQPEVCTSAIPANIRAGMLAREVITILHASPTFRAQCERIAAVPSVHVDMIVVQSRETPRTETSIARYAFGAIRADVRIAFGQDYREMIAHEFEHVIEQIDGVDLRAEAATRGAWLIDRNVFETRRASEAGKRVRRECEISESHAAAENHHELRGRARRNDLGRGQ